LSHWRSYRSTKTWMYITRLSISLKHTLEVTKTATAVRPLRSLLGGRLLLRPILRTNTLAQRLLSSPPSKALPEELPTIADAAGMPRHLSDLSGEQIYLLAESCAHHGAVRERLRREIMVIDGIEYAHTSKRLLEMGALIKGGHTMLKLPFEVGIWTSLIAGWASIPLVFHFSTAQLFNDKFVTADPPDVGEADTWLEVGSWSWGWMEPPLGTISFFLLCIQFAREQRFSIGGKPITERIQDQQADKMLKAFPQYDETIVRAYAASIALCDDSEHIAAEQARIEALVLAPKQ